MTRLGIEPRSPGSLVNTLLFQFYFEFSQDSKVHDSASFLFSFFFSFFFFVAVNMSGRLVEIRWCVSNSKSQGSLRISFPRTDSWLHIYHLLVWPNFNSLHSSQWITLPIQSCLVLSSFSANLPHSLIMRLIVVVVIIIVIHFVIFLHQLMAFPRSLDNRVSS